MTRIRAQPSRVLPTSGSGFPVGTTTVHCTATDLDGQRRNGLVRRQGRGHDRPDAAPASADHRRCHFSGGCEGDLHRDRDRHRNPPPDRLVPSGFGGDVRDRQHHGALHRSSTRCRTSATGRLHRAREGCLRAASRTISSPRRSRSGKPGKSLASKVREIQEKANSHKKREACKPLDAFAKEVKARAGKSLTRPAAAGRPHCRGSEDLLRPRLLTSARMCDRTARPRPSGRRASWPAA